MTDYDGPPLTRRERKERERLLAEATGQTPVVDAPSEDQPAEAQEPEAQEPEAEQPGADEPEAEEPDVQEPEVDEPEVQEPEVATSPVVESVPEPERPRSVEPDETQAIDVSELIADLRPQSAPTADGGPQGQAPQAQPTGLGRFFGRRGIPTEPAAAPVEASAPEAAAPEAAAPEAAAPEVAAPEAAAPGVESEHRAPESIADVLADLQPDREEPTRPAGQSIPRIEVDDLDTVDDAEVDRLEIDEVVVADAPVSSRRIAESTPALLEDRRELDEDGEVEVQAGPSRGTGRLPVIVNVVEDTSRHHIADLRDDTSAISASSVGTGTSAITANALVLPTSGLNEPIMVETAEGVIVTGSIDLPDGFASSGRSRGTIDTSELDAGDDGGEVRSPETQPVRASRAVSSYANARVRIAPQRRTRNALPIVLGVGGGIGIAAIGVTVFAFIVGWI